MDDTATASDPRSIRIAPYSGRAIKVSAGDFIRITDPKGQEVSDLWAFLVGDGLDWLSTSQTRDINESLFPTVGQSFYSDMGHPLLTLVEDASPGPHDMLFPACNSALFERAGLPDHPSCRDNLLLAMRKEGISLPFVPDPVDFFQNSLPSADGKLDVFASINPPGGFVVLRAECDLLLVVTACSVDFHPTNGDRCTEIDVTVSPGHTQKEVRR